MHNLPVVFKLVLFITGPFALYGLWLIYRKLQEKKLWRECDKTPFPQEFLEILEKEIVPYQFLTEDEKSIFIRKIKYFLATKNISGVGDLEVTDRMKLIVAAEACLLIIRVSPRVYPGLTNVFLMEDTYLLKDNPVNPYTGQPVDSPKLGEAWKRGPIVLSWKAVKQDLRSTSRSSHLIVHEFSHNLDQQDGIFDGTPKLATDDCYQRWAQVMGKEFTRLRKRMKTSRSSDIDFYGATNEAEFFAVLAEYYMTRPRRLQKLHPEIYENFNNFFKLDPIRWDLEKA